MRSRAISLVILLAFGAGTVAGMPLHSGEQSCNMSSAMGDMDCCQKAALAQGAMNEISAARLCCALNCSREGTTPSNGTTIPKPNQTAFGMHLAGTPSALPPALSPRSLSVAYSPSNDSHPAYIRHLALLI